MWCQKADVMKWWVSPWWPWSWRWRGSSLRALRQEKSDHTWACPLCSLSLSPCLMFACPFPASWKRDLICSSYCLPQFWLCHSSFICMQQDVLPSAAFCIYLVLWQLFLGWMLPVCSYLYTCFPCWWSCCSDTYVKCSCIVCVYAITMAQSAYKLLLVRLFSMLVLYLVQGKLILLYPKQCTLSFLVSRISALATTSLIFL